MPHNVLSHSNAPEYEMFTAAPSLLTGHWKVIGKVKVMKLTEMLPSHTLVMCLPLLQLLTHLRESEFRVLSVCSIYCLVMCSIVLLFLF